MSQQLSSKEADSTQLINDYPYIKGESLGWFNQAHYLLQNPTKSYIYFIQAYHEGLDPLVKIGLSMNPDRRFMEIMRDFEQGKYEIDWLALGVADDFRILGLVEGTQDLETAFHKAFNKYKAGREWFWLTDELEALIDEVLDQHCVCRDCLIADEFIGVTKITLT